MFGDTMAAEDSGCTGSVELASDNLAKVRGTCIAHLKRHKFRIHRSIGSEHAFQIRAVRGNRLMGYVFEQALSVIPFHEWFGWAVRVKLDLVARRNGKDGPFVLAISCEPLSNELNPLDSAIDAIDGSDWVEQMGENKRCREAYDGLIERLRQSGAIG